MIIIGCDFHPRFQQIAFLDQETGEYFERRLHHPEEVTLFYRSLKGKQVKIGAEATGSLRWFRRLTDELGYESRWRCERDICIQPAPAKTDKRDARHILKLLKTP